MIAAMASNTLAFCLVLLPMTESLGREEKALVKEVRKKVAVARKNVTGAFICRACKGSGRVIRRVKFGSRNEFSREQRIDCEKCRSLGVHYGRAVHDAMRDYYSLIAAQPQHLRPHLEDTPTLARWMIQKVSVSHASAFFTSQWVNYKNSTKQGSAYLIVIEGAGAYRNANSDWTIVLGTVVNTKAPVAVLFYGWVPPDLKRVVQHGAPERIIILGYSEGKSAYNAWLEQWQSEIDSLRRSNTNPEHAESQQEIATALSGSIKAIARSGHFLTGADAVRMK